MADISLKEEMARQWIQDVNNEITQVESLLKTIAQAASTIPGEDDDIMKGIESTCNTLQNFWNQMCSGFKKTGSLISEAIQRIGKAADEVVKDVQNVQKRIGS